MLARPRLDPEMLHVLPIVQPFHDQRVVKCYWLGEIGFENGLMRAGWRRPERLGIAV